ncbi:hypothetical protein [Chromatium okenii]|nr:hypothetical protein [Chromatium okenii]
MKITQDVRDYALAHQIDAVETALEVGMQEQAQKFREDGAVIYQAV